MKEGKLLRHRQNSEFVDDEQFSFPSKTTNRVILRHVTAPFQTKKKAVCQSLITLQPQLNLWLSRLDD